MTVTPSIATNPAGASPGNTQSTHTNDVQIDWSQIPDHATSWGQLKRVVKALRRELEPLQWALPVSTPANDTPDPPRAAVDANDASHAARRAQSNETAARWGAVAVCETASWTLPTPRMVVPGLGLGPGRPPAFIGPPGGGKTQALYSTAVAIAVGRPAMGRFETDQARVLLVSYDQNRSAVELTLRRICNGMGIGAGELLGHLDVICMPERNLVNASDSELGTLFYNYGFIVFDTLRDGCPGQEENDSRFGQYPKKLQRAAGELRTACYIAHTPLESAHRPRGTSAILGASGTTWSVTGTGSEARTMRNERTHDFLTDMLPTYVLEMARGNEGPFDVPCAPRSTVLTADAQQLGAGEVPKGVEQVREFVESNCSAGERVPALRHVAAACGISPTTAAKCLKYLESEGTVTSNTDPETGKPGQGWVRAE